MTLQELAPYITAVAGVFCFLTAAKNKDFLGLLIAVGLILSASIRLLLPIGSYTNALSMTIMVGVVLLILVKFRASRKRAKQKANQLG